MINVFTVPVEGKQAESALPGNSIPEVFPQNSVVWIDVEGTEQADMQLLKERLSLDEFSMEDVVVGNQRPKIVDYDHYNFGVVRVPSDEKVGISFSELFLFFSEGWIVTIHKTPMKIVDLAKERIKARGLSLFKMKPSTDLLFYLLVDFAVDSFYPVLDAKEDEIDSLERQIETTVEQKRGNINRIRSISKSFMSLKGDLMTLRRDASTMRDVLGQIMRGAVPFIHDQVLRNFRDVYDHAFQLIETLDTYRERVNEVRDLHISMITASTNNVVKVLTIVVTILTPLSLIAGIYGTNFTPGFFTPGTGLWYSFYVMVAIMAGIAATMAYFFRRAGWI